MNLLYAIVDGHLNGLVGIDRDVTGHTRVIRIAKTELALTAGMRISPKNACAVTRGLGSG